MSVTPKALNIKPRQTKSVDNTVSMTNQINNEPKVLNINPRKKEEQTNNIPAPLVINKSNTTTLQTLEVKYFDLSFEFLKKKIPNITTFTYANIKDVLKNVEITPQNNFNGTVLLDMGKKLQESIAEKTLSINNNHDFDLLDDIKKSHSIICECIEINKKGFFENFTNKFFGKSIGKEDIHRTLSTEVYKNKSYRQTLSQMAEKYPRVFKQMEDYRDELEVYLEVLKLLLEEFSALQMNQNIDIVNKRIISLVQSKAMLDNTIIMITQNKQKFDLYIDNIDNVVNILVPTILNKISLGASMSTDSEYQQVSNQILTKLSQN